MQTITKLSEDLQLRAEEHSWVIEELRTSDTGNDYTRPIGYYITIEGAAAAIFELGIKHGGIISAVKTKNALLSKLGALSEAITG